MGYTVHRLVSDGGRHGILLFTFDTGVDGSGGFDDTTRQCYCSFVYGVFALHEKNIGPKLVDLGILMVSLILLVIGSQTG